jgi:uncharacterized protein (UPF0548 family)
MFSIRKPSVETVRRFFDRQKTLDFSYAEVGASRETPPVGYDFDHHRVRLGEGQAVFRAAYAALWRWEMFNFPWVELYKPQTPIAQGEVVAFLASGLGLWSLNACRIVYVLEQIGEVETRGFAYGTLPGHVETGEERFSVQWHHADDSVWYDLRAFSRPNHILARIGYRFVRRLQKRFAADSMAAMARAVKH